jgi:hypothetical protein
MKNIDELIILLHNLENNPPVEVNAERLYQLIIENKITPEEFNELYKDFISVKRESE